MKKLKNVDLSKKTTFKVGGIARNYYIPDSPRELCYIVDNIGNEAYYVISGGSNLLINDNRVYEHVISMMSVDKSLENLNNGCFYIGASNRIQNVISFVNECGYGGFEELIGLPALFGGIIYMNAGIGGRERVLFNISDFILRVKCFDRSSKKIIWIGAEKCDFLYRHSIFMDNRYIIVGAEIKCNPQSKVDSQERIRKRREYCKNKQVWGKGCFGSCFSAKDNRLLKFTYAISKFTLRGIYVSKNNSNWIINNGKANYRETIRYISMCEFIHHVFHKDIQREICIWD